jgi:hypothetical protein
VNIIGFIAGIVLFVGGLVLMGYSFQPIDWLPHVLGIDPRSAVFFAGIMATVVGFAIPIHVMKRIDG